MSGLRETKKAATRSALARAAAEIALREGSEGLTVAAITQAAGVSPRTFHNYFGSREEALQAFFTARVQSLVAELDQLPAELDLLSAVERLVIANLYAEDAELESFATLFRLGEILEMLGAVPTPHNRQLGALLDPMLPIVHPRLPGYSDFEVTVMLRVIGGAVSTALEWHYGTPQADRDPAVGEQFVRRAIDVLRRT
ncbi:TetR/AcrR family transcriptional regulator [Corynebacterium halotolerans]|uniref:TetR/AcrR family transcriptional regulator n=1 Tax=Corynebacterium halotolerans TaxID=225326 RepID=UPI003CEBCC9E